MTPDRRRLASFLAALILLIGATGAASASGLAIRATDDAAPGGRLIVLWRGEAPNHLGLDGVKRTESASTATQRSLVVARPGEAGRVAATLRQDPRVIAVVPDAVVKPFDWPADGDPSDPLFGQQEDLPQIGVPSVWPTTTGDPGVVVAVIDTGIDLTHPDIAGVTIVSPRNEIWNNADVTDEIGHGTHVAGTIIARTDNGIGIAGIAPDTSLMPIKVFDGDGNGSFFDVLDAVDWARTHGADIINMSLGSTLSHEQVALVQPTFTAARSAGILMVAASGNSGARIMEYPAGLNGVVSVGAVDQNDVIADFSTFNRGVDLTAPGVDTLSTIDGDYSREEGTSMASPHVAGVAALIWAARPALDVDELEAVLRASAVDLGDPGRDDVYGSGRIDAAAALTEPIPDPIPDLEPAPGPAGDFTIDITAPTHPIVQTRRHTTVSWTVSHEAVDGILVRLFWQLHHRTCPDEFEPYLDYEILDFVSPTTDTGLAAGFCYRYDIIAIDEDGEIAEAISAPVSVLDLIRPTIKSRSPRPDATGVKTTSSISIKFSEDVKGVSSRTVRLKNLATGLWVRATVRYSSRTHRATIDPARSMFHATRYAVYVTDGVHDPSGNRLRATHWSFRTGS